MTKVVKEIMTVNPKTFTVPSEVRSVVKMLIQNNLTGLPITDLSGKYIGMVSRRDIFENPHESQTAMVMRRAKAANMDDPIESAAMELNRQGRRHLAVVDENNMVVGILTPQNFLQTIRTTHGTKKVKELGDFSSVCVYEEDPVSVVSHIMRISRTYAAPVLNLSGEFTGLVTDRDLFDKIDIEPRMETSETGMADDEDPWSWEGIRNVFTYIIVKNNVQLPNSPVKNIMVRNPVSTNTNDALDMVIRKMESGNYNQLPVFRGSDELVGMLFDTQLLKILY
ncbi:MAG: CBS domain-containing protein [Candidatus Thermoplasmatota archaeon]|nr:CBS domain-containing protein [Candidatus Thermoplasmatota archaeon]